MWIDEEESRGTPGFVQSNGGNSEQRERQTFTQTDGDRQVGKRENKNCGNVGWDEGGG